jgi:hypothetical protein
MGTRQEGTHEELSAFTWSSEGDRILLSITQDTNTKLFFCQKSHETAEYGAKQPEPASPASGRRRYR